MTKTPFLLSFCGIFILIFTLFSYRMSMSTAYKNVSTKYRESLRITCEASLQEAIDNIEKRNKSFYLFKSKEQRDKCIDTFYKSLRQNFGYVDSQIDNTELYNRIPVICLVDTDGFYIIYNELMDDGGYVLVNQVTTSINTWSRILKNGEWSVRFFTNDRFKIELTNLTSGEVLSGSYNKVYNEAGSPIELQTYFSTLEEYMDLRDSVIIDTTQETIEYYINKSNYAVNSIKGGKNYGRQYTFTMPKVEATDWAEVMDHSSVIAFMQGKQIDDTVTDLNIYSMRGTELANKQYYYSDGEEYHKIGCTKKDIKTEDLVIYTTKSDCAKAGLMPCPVCNP